MPGKPKTFFNSMQAGRLPTHEARNPLSQRYANGLITAENARFIGGRVTHANGCTPITDLILNCDKMPYPDGRYYLRNTDEGSVKTASSVPNDTASGAGVTETFNDRLERMINQQLHIAHTGNSDPVYKSYGKADVGLGNYSDNRITDINARVLNNGEAFNVTKKIRYVRAVVYTNTDTGKLQWAILGKKTQKKTDKWSYGAFAFGRSQETRDETGSYPITICNGSEGVSGSRDDTNGAPPPVTQFSTLEASISIEPIINTIDRGTPVAGISLYLVGKMRMFSGFTDPKSYTYSASNIGGVGGKNVDLNTSKVTQSQSGYEDIYILRWATATEDQINLALLETGSDPVQALAPLNTITYPFTFSAPGVNQTIFFSTVRNKVLKLRRVGICQLIDSGGASPSSQPTTGTDFYIGFSKLVGTKGDGNVRIIAGTAGDPYVVPLGSTPRWIELGYQGIFCGTDEAEFLISNEQDQTKYTVQRISSVGCGSGQTDYIDASTSLNGNIYFLTKRGMSHLQFSTEKQSFIPQTIDMIDMGFAKPKSIASSKQLNCIVIHCEDGTFVQIAPDTGAISTIIPLNPTDGTTFYSIVGLSTDNGEARFVWVSGSSYKQNFLSDTSFLTTTIETTAFGSMPEAATKLNRLFISMSDTFGGQIVVGGQLKADGSPDWQQLKYDSVATQNASFTGIMRIDLNMVIDNQDAGKTILLQFSAQDKMNISYVAVEGEI